MTTPDTPSGWDTPDEVPPRLPRGSTPFARAPSLRAPCPAGPRHPVTGSQPWYRTKQAATCSPPLSSPRWCVAVGWSLRSPSTTAEQSTIEAPTSAPPAPSSVAPTAASAPKPPPAPPPSAATSATVGRASIPRRNGSIRSRGTREPTPAQKPRVDVDPSADERRAGAAAGCRKRLHHPRRRTREKPRRRGCFGFC